MNRTGTGELDRRRSGEATRAHDGLLRAGRSSLAAVAVFLVALALPAAPQPGDLHALRMELADARAALRAAEAGAGASPRQGFASGVGLATRGQRMHHPQSAGRAGVRDASAGSRPAGAAADSAPERPDLAAARVRVRNIEAAVEDVIAGSDGSNVLVGLVGQARALLAGPPGADTAGRLALPVRGVVTSGFGPRRVPSWGQQVIHEGIDIFALPGTPVRAAAGGKVVAAGEEARSGLGVVIDHGTDVEGRTLRTVYSHLHRIDVEVGDRVAEGERIGAVGNTGTHSTGPHLHFEVHVEGEAVDPRAWL